MALDFSGEKLSVNRAVLSPMNTVVVYGYLQLSFSVQGSPRSRCGGSRQSSETSFYLLRALEDCPPTQDCC